MADYKLLSAVLADYADKAGTAETANSATSATTATTASKLSVGTVGSASVPVYFSNGVPVEATEVSSGGASWTSGLWSANSNTTSDILSAGDEIFYVICTNDSQNMPEGCNAFVGIYIATQLNTGIVCGTWYDYDSATVVSGFWSNDDFDDYISDFGKTAVFYYLA